MSPEQAGKAIGSWAIVEGRVRSVGNVGNQVYLNFGPDWRTDFTVSISGTARRAFLAQGIDPLRLNGQLIRVRGWLESWNGPHIKADHPGQVEFRAEDPAEKAVRTGEAGTGSVPSMKSLSFSAPEPP